ncbi:iron-sulfur cluster carrier protein ApbC [Alteromonas sediminis]|uniref:Iron-sulfur cluster carrier protein n=1 Tax=Alteromonas sediminis TaxID=2259342 RepID=A0A3N5XXH1_9ALTE|nr:iron-sulfur cluster carrier protein ApbC [Alteromonas sediminis]RPJ65143.1 iron-sulfur cluster carrier protein ApbC [Alteromonas sediminis]
MFFKSSRNKKALRVLLDSYAQDIAAHFSLAKESVPAEWFHLDAKVLTVTLPFACQSQHDELTRIILQNAHAKEQGIDKVQINTQIPSFATHKDAVINIKNIVAVSSGKGGVGKSATAVNLAYALLQEGARVGILDADIYGPSIPTMLGNKTASPASSDNKTMTPISAHGIVANSIGYLVPEEDAAVWRGPVASKALLQLLNETRWPVLDYLIVDMPPGTGDVQLTMAQQVPLTAAIVVTTPQDLALADAQKGIAMFDKVDVPVVGLVENMSAYVCDNCGHVAHIFSKLGGSRLAERYALPLLGSLPLSLSIREYADAGTPLLLKADKSDAEKQIAQMYQAVAIQMGAQLSAGLELRAEQSSHLKGDPIAIQIE